MAKLQYMWYGTRPSISFSPSETVTQSEGFETFPTLNQLFQINNPSLMPGTTKGWESGAAYAHSGTSSIKNQTMPSIAGTPQYARIDINFAIPSYARNIKIGYWYYQDSEVNFDGLKVYLNSTLIHNYITSGTYGAWTYGEIVTQVTGAKTLTFEYFKDGKTDGGVTDSVYIDDLFVSWEVHSISETPGAEIIRFDGSTGYHMMYHRTGAVAPPINLVEQRVPFQPGSMFQYMDIQPRDVELGVMVIGSDASDLRNKVRTLASKLIGVDGALYARYTDGSERRLYCMYKEGLEGEETKNTMGAGYFQKVILVFRAFDPFWYKTGHCESKSTQNFIQYKNNGDRESWPMIWVEGKATNPDLAIWKVGTGEPDEGAASRLKVNTIINDTRRLIIDTKRKMITLDDGTNLYGSIDSVANNFQPVPNDGGTYNFDIDISGSEADGRFHVYVEEPYWGV